MTVKLTLYKVLLPWNQNDAEQGDYCMNVWAKDDTEAIRLTAETMADEPESGVGADATADEREQFIAELISGAGAFAAAVVAVTVMNDIDDLLKGPDGSLTDEAKKDFALIASVLEKYSAIA